MYRISVNAGNVMSDIFICVLHYPVLIWLFREGIAMKRKIIIIFICVAAVAVGIFLDRTAHMDIENSKKKVPEQRLEKTDDRAEKLQEALEVDNDDGVVIEDVDKELEDQNFSSLRYAAYTDEGFYVYDNSTDLVSFVDKESCKMVPLCSKPDCAHNDEACDAFYCTLQAIFAYDDKIYVVAEDMKTSTMCLYRLNRDGSGRTLIKSLFAIENGSAYSFGFALHKGCLYMISDTFDDDIYTEDDSVLYCYALDSKDKKEILSYKGYQASISIINFDGDNIYLRVFERAEPSFKAEEVCKYFCYNIKDETMAELNVPKEYDVDYCYNDRILAVYSEYDPATYFITKYEMNQFDLDGKNRKTIYTNENFEFCHYCVDSKYVYMIINKDEKGYLIVISHDGKKVYRTDAKDYSMLIWSDKKDVLLKSETTGKYALCNIKTGEMKEVCAR